MKHINFGLLVICLILIAGFTVVSVVLDKSLTERDELIGQKASLRREVDNLEVIVAESNVALRAADKRIESLIEYSAQIAALDAIDMLMSPTDIDTMLDLIPHGNPFSDTWAITSRFDADAGFGGNPRRNHTGMDVVPRGNSNWLIQPIADGTVVDIGIGQFEGKWILIEHNEFVRTKVMHLEKIFYTALPGEWVTPGTNIGVMGSTGYSDAAHLHIEIQVFDGEHWIPIDPLPFLEGQA